MRRTALIAAVLAALSASLPAHSATCRIDALPNAIKLSDAPVRLAYRIQPGAIKVGAPFAVEVIACIDPDSMTPRRIRVDARMPAHGHGMNYKPSEKKIGPGHARFDGFVFHMPGRWALNFDVFSAAGRKRLTVGLDVKR